MHRSARSIVPALCAAALAAAGAAAAETEFVTVSGDALRAGDRPCAFACAAGIRLPEPDATAGTNALDEARAAARLLARDLALAGFNMVRLPDLAVPRAGDPATEARLAVQDEFVAACKDEGVHVWAEALHPVLDFAPSPADADALDDPATREAWREAVADTNFPAASLLLAAPWDPRLEILVQRRLRDWARAFNPRTGLRRCDDPAYALFSFSTLWWEDLDADALPELPPFLARGLADAWNDWLYERYGTDLALRDRFPLDSGVRCPGEGGRRGAVPHHRARWRRDGHLVIRRTCQQPFPGAVLHLRDRHRFRWGRVLSDLRHDGASGHHREPGAGHRPHRCRSQCGD